MNITDLLVSLDQTIGLSALDQHFGWIYGLILRRRRSRKAPSIGEDLAAVMTGRGTHKLEWLGSEERAPIELERMLKKRGVMVWGRGGTNLSAPRNERIYFLHVGHQQAAWADYTLRRAGVPMVSKELSNAQPTGAPPAWRDRTRKARRWARRNGIL